MELPFEKTVCRHWKQKLYQLHHQEQTQELRIPDGMGDASRVIASWGQVILRGKEWRERGIGINGGIMVWVLYQSEEDGQLQKLESWIPFQAKIDFAAGDEDGAIRVQTALKNVDARIISSRKLMLRCSLGLLVQALVPAQTELYTCPELPDDLEVLRSVYPLMLTKEAGELPFLIDETLELPVAVSPVRDIIYCTLEPELLDQKVLGSRGVFRGMGNLHILYWDQNGILCTFDFQVPFAQYLDLEEEYGAEAQISNLLCVTSLELNVHDDGELHLRCGIVSQYTVRDQSIFDIVEDAYSPCRDVELTRQSLTIPALLDSRQQTVEMSCSINEQDELPVDRWFQLDLPRISKEQEQTQISSDGTFSALMENKDSIMMQRDGKASADTRFATGCTTDTVCFSWRKGGVNCRREGSNWRVDTQVVLDLSSICSRPIEAVTSMQLGEERGPSADRPSVIIRAKGMDGSLWDLAKRCGSTVSAIERINKLEGEPDPEQLLLIPVI